MGTVVPVLYVGHAGHVPFSKVLWRVQVQAVIFFATRKHSQKIPKDPDPPFSLATISRKRPIKP